MNNPTNLNPSDAVPKTLAEWFDRFENEYAFECEGGPLKNCLDWVLFKKSISFRADSPPPLQGGGAG